MSELADFLLGIALVGFLVAVAFGFVGGLLSIVCKLLGL